METQRDEARAEPGLGRYTIDTGRSALTFKTRHIFGLAGVNGTFAVRSGTVDVTDPLEGSAIHAEIDAASFDSGNSQRDRTVRSGTYLDTERHPVITFDAERVETTAITGSLTVCGVTRPVSLAVERSEVGSGSFTVRATTRIDRTEFGLTAGRGMTGRYLDIRLDITCVNG